MNIFDAFELDVNVVNLAHYGYTNAEIVSNIWYILTATAVFVKRQQKTQQLNYLPEHEHNAADDYRQDDDDCDNDTHVQTHVSPNGCEKR